MRRTDTDTDTLTERHIDTDAAPARTRAGSALPGWSRPRRRGRSSWRKRAELAILLGPAVVLFVGFVLIPIIVAVYYSAYQWSGFGPLTNFVGVQNYRKALTDPVFHQAVLHNLI